MLPGSRRLGALALGELDRVSNEGDALTLSLLGSLTA
jgi:hypothetical protein